jgi:hypothetical protein
MVGRRPRAHLASSSSAPRLVVERERCYLLTTDSCSTRERHVVSERGPRRPRAHLASSSTGPRRGGERATNEGPPCPGCLTDVGGLFRKRARDRGGGGRWWGWAARRVVVGWGTNGGELVVTWFIGGGDGVVGWWSRGLRNGVALVGTECWASGCRVLLRCHQSVGQVVVVFCSVVI